MYCERCGSLLDGTEQRCNVCGKEVQGSGIRLSVPDAEEIVFNPPYSGEDEIVWDVHEFPKPQKTEDIEFRWGAEERQKAQEPHILHVQEEPEGEESLEEEIFKDLREDRLEKNDPANIDKFFTFSKKNEEFQQLLDREYEKIRKRADLSLPQAAQTLLEIESIEPANLAEIIAEAGQEAEMPKEEPAPLAEESIPTGEEPLMQTEEPGQIEVQAPDRIKEVKAEKKRKGKHTQAYEMQEARLSFFHEKEIEAEPAEPVMPKIEVEEKAEAAIQGAQLVGDAAIQGAQSTEGTSIQDIPSTAPSPENGDSANPIEAEAAVDPSVTNIHRFLDEAAQGQVGRLAGQKENPVNEAQEKTGRSKKKGCLGMGMIVILILILLLEGMTLGIKYFAPHSAASAYLTKTQGPMVDAVVGWIGQIKDSFDGSVPAKVDQDEAQKEDGKDQDDQEKEEDTAAKDASVPDPVPMTDKGKLIASQMALNQHIEKIVSNDALAYQPQKDYGVKGINQSKPIENNIWKTTEEGKTLYYDQAVVGAVISFNSSWIDYVNAKNSQVFSYLQKGSKAYENAAAFSKTGKVTEAFNLLEFGEIRQSEKGFYVWVHEEITMTEKGVTTSKQHNWIYYLEPSENQMEIVNYFKFQ